MMDIIGPISKSVAVSFYGDAEPTQLREYREAFELGLHAFFISVYGGGLFAVLELVLHILFGRPMIYSSNFHGYLLMGAGTLLTLGGSLIPEHWKDTSTTPRIKAGVHTGVMIFISGLFLGLPINNESMQQMYHRLFDDTQGLQELSVGIFVFVSSNAIPFIIIGLLIWSIWRWSQDNEAKPINSTK